MIGDEGALAAPKIERFVPELDLGAASSLTATSSACSFGCTL